eukprot:Gb_08109 [translate_table: standard]
MESFEPMMKRPRGYDAPAAENGSGLPWTAGANMNSGVNFNPGVNLNQGGNLNPVVNNVPSAPMSSGYPGSFPTAMPGGTFGMSTGTYENGDFGGFQHSAGGDLECRRYNTPDGCPYGTNCRFRHGPTDDRELSHQMLSSGSKCKPCIKFFSTSGCPYGEGCHFLHYVPGGINALGLAPLATVPSTVMAPTRKQAGPVADPSLTVNGYKTRLCNRFNTPEGCRFGDKCHFAHGESDLRAPSNFRPSNRPMTGEAAMQSGPGTYNAAPVMYDNGTPASYPNSTTYTDSTTYGNSAGYSNNTFASTLSYAEPTPPGVAANTPFIANYAMPVENSTTQLTAPETSITPGPVIGNNVQVY